MRDRNTIPITSLVVLALIPAILLGGVWGLAEANEPAATTTTTTTLPPPPVDEMATDLFSFRRHPTPIAEVVATAESEAAFAALSDGFTSTLGDGTCATIRRGDEIIVDAQGETALIPASNMKLLVAAVALDVLGPDHRFRTELRSAPIVGGVVPGDVYVIGGGDPVLVTSDFVDPKPLPAFNTTTLDVLADQLVAAGVTRIDGDIVGDGSRYDDEFRVDAWGDGITFADAGPYDALLVNDGMIGNGNFAIVPAQSAANEVERLLEARGIEVVGSARQAPVPGDAALSTLAFVESEPLSDVLVELLHTSDNNTAELLLKAIGRADARRIRRAGKQVRRMGRQLPQFDSIWLDALAQCGVITRWQAGEIAAGRGASLKVGPYAVTEPLADCLYARAFRARHIESGHEVRLIVDWRDGRAAQEAAALRTVLAHQPPQALEFGNRLTRLQHVV